MFKGTLPLEGETRLIMRRCAKVPCLLKEGPADSLSPPVTEVGQKKKQTHEKGLPTVKMRVVGCKEGPTLDAPAWSP